MVRLNIKRRIAIGLGDAMPLSKKYWVIRMGDYVELRSSIYPIKAIKTKLTKIRVTKTRHPYLDYTTGNYRYEVVERPVKTVLEQTYFEGGKILATYLFHNWPKVAKDLGLAALKGDCAFNITRDIALVLQRRKG